MGKWVLKMKKNNNNFDSLTIDTENLSNIFPQLLAYLVSTLQVAKNSSANPAYLVQMVHKVRFVILTSASLFRTSWFRFLPTTSPLR